MYHVLTIITFIIVLGVLIFVHELGHFVLARICRVRVEKFSLGFGPRIIGITRGHTEYKISAIPLGGYVKLAGEDPDKKSRIGATYELFSRPKYQQFLIFAAGPCMNLILPFLILPLVYIIGVNVSGINSSPPVVGEVIAGGPAEAAGLVRGDTIVAVDDNEISNLSDLIMMVASNPDTPLIFEVKRNASSVELSFTPSANEKTGTGDIGFKPLRPPIVYGLEDGYPAHQAGIMEGDLIVSINSVKVDSWEDMSELIASGKESPIDVGVERDGRILSFSITPVFEHDPAFIGIKSTRLKKYSFGEAIVKSLGEIKSLTLLTFEVIGKLVTLKLPLKVMGGPVQIYSITGQAASSGISELLFLVALLSLNLGIINLFPFPPLDGGLILFLGIETLIRKDVPIKVREWSQTVGLVLLIMLMLLVTYYDILRIS